ncbi:MAG: amidohydrolase family protein, partial [Bacteroidota bacterium]
LIRDGLIAEVGANVRLPDTLDAVIDCTDHTIYPGMIDAGTTLGIREVGSLPESQDVNEVGELAPQMKALTAVNPNSILIPVTRVAGITTALTVPSGGLMPGEAALVDLFGYTPEQMYADFSALVIEFPRSGKRGWWDRRSDDEIEKAYKNAVKKLDEAWDAALAYARIDSAYAANPDAERLPEYVPAIQAMLPAVRGEMPVLIQANTAGQLRAAVKWAGEREIEDAILSGCAEGWRVADELAEAGRPCIVGPVLSTPTRSSDRYDKPYANAGLLHAAGVKIALRTNDMMGNFRNLPFHAGFAAAYGLGKDAALRAVTLGPAEIFGLGDQLGSIEAGKKANLFVANGDPFEPKTDVVHVFIDGFLVPMTSLQQQLYEEFLDREPGLME